MTGETVQQLRDAASEAHRRGNTEEAIALFEKILALHPETPEAVDAVFYLSSIGKAKGRQPARRAPAEPPATRERKS